MKNKYIVLAGMYRYTEYFFEEQPSKEAIEKEYLDFTRGNNLISKLTAKPLLKDWYGIKNAEDVYKTINQLKTSFYIYIPIVSILTDIYLTFQGDFLNFSDTIKLEEFLNREYLLNVLKYFEKSSKTNTLTEKETEEYLDEIQCNIFEIFANKELTNHYYELFKTFHDYLPYLKGPSIMAFNISRCIDLIAFANVANYIETDKANELINEMGENAESLFSDWQQYLISAIIGKYIMSFSGKPRLTVTEADQYRLDCCKLAVNHYKPLEISGIWVNSDVSFLANELKQIDTGKSSSIYEKTGDVANNILLPLFEKHDLLYLLNENRDTRSFKTFFDDDENLYYFFENAKEKPFEVNLSQVPILLKTHAFGCGVLITSKGIQVKKKKLFGKASITRLDWDCKIEFKPEVTSLSDVSILANNEKIIKWELDYAKKGYTQVDFFALDKKKVEEIWKDEISNMVNFFYELQEIFLG